MAPANPGTLRLFEPATLDAAGPGEGAPVPGDPLDEALGRVTSRRGRHVVAELRAKGSVTKNEIRLAGYHHPARAVQDVRDAGVPVVAEMVAHPDGGTQASYSFGDASDVWSGSGSRTQVPRALKTTLVAEQGARCAFDGAEMDPGELQVEHRVPFGVSSEAERAWDPEDFALACGSHNMTKKQACGQCPNFTGDRDPAVCGSCYWARPDDHTHVATVPRRRLDLVFDGPEAEAFDAFCAETGTDPARAVKDLLAARVAAGRT